MCFLGPFLHLLTFFIHIDCFVQKVSSMLQKVALKLTIRYSLHFLGPLLGNYLDLSCTLAHGVSIRSIELAYCQIRSRHLYFSTAP